MNIVDLHGSTFKHIVPYICLASVMESALMEIKAGVSTVGQASRAHGIPETTLRTYATRVGISVKKVCF